MFLSFLENTCLDLNCCEIINQYSNTDVYLHIHISYNNYECFTSCLLTKYTWEYIKEQSKYIYNDTCSYIGTFDGKDIRIESDIGTLISSINVSYDIKDIIAFKNLYENRRFVGNFNIIREIFKKCILYQKRLQTINQLN